MDRCGKVPLACLLFAALGQVAMTCPAPPQYAQRPASDLRRRSSKVSGPRGPREPSIYMGSSPGGGKGRTGGGNWWETRRGVAAGCLLLLLVVVGSGTGGSEQVVLDGNGCSDISLECGGYGSLRGKLEPDRLFNLPREKVNEGMIRPKGLEVVGDVLEGNG